MSDTFTIPDERNAVFRLGVDARARFLTRTYTTLFGAIVAFVLIELALFQTTLPERAVTFLAGGSYRWLLFLGGFMLIGSMASKLAYAARSPGAQYAALIGYVVLEALIFMPLLLIAQAYGAQSEVGGIIESAAFVTLAAFAGLTAIVFVTKKDFSFLRGVVVYGGLVALVAIVAAVVFDFGMGAWFSGAMVALAGAMILYQTSNILHHYPEDSHVAAALSLFASVALMFWYVLRLFMLSRD